VNQTTYPLAQGVEKTVSTAVQATILAVAAAWYGGHDLDWSLGQQLLIALLPTALTALTAFSAKISIPESIPKWQQGALRAIRTTVVMYLGFLGPFVAAPGFTFDRASLWSALLGAGGAMLAAAKAAIFGRVGNTSTVAALPASKDTPIVDGSTAPIVLPTGGVLIPPADDPNAYDDAGPKVAGEVPAWAGVDTPSPPR